MSAHLLQISAERLATLPEGLLARTHKHGWDGRTFKLNRGAVMLRFGHASECDTVRGPAWLVLDDTVTAAVVAAKIVLPYVVVDRPHGQEVRCSMQEHLIMADAAWMKSLTPAQTETLARLAQAAMSSAPEATP